MSLPSHGNVSTHLLFIFAGTVISLMIFAQPIGQRIHSALLGSRLAETNRRILWRTRIARILSLWLMALTVMFA